MSVLNIVVGDSGLKMKLSEDQTPPTGGTPTIYDSSAQNATPLPRGSMRVSTSLSATIITGNAVPISRLANVLQGQLGHMIFDKTALTELFDFKLRFSSQNQPLPSLRADGTPPLAGSSLLTAIQELGLKLESSKAPLEVLVIDSVQKPSEN
jgi:uncharacterized protein (TIGR03435 family)